MIEWAALCALTVVVEILVALGLGRLFRAARLPWTDVALVNLVTHPIAWSLHGLAIAPLSALELGVIAAEAAAYRFGSRRTWTAAIVVGVTCNAITWALGVTLFNL